MLICYFYTINKLTHFQTNVNVVGCATEKSLLYQNFFGVACLPDLAAAFAPAFPPPFALGGRFCCWGLAVFFAPLSDLFLKLPKFFHKACVDELLYGLCRGH
ncbi:hypothetical protein PsorP6_012291 [Peronosclerospora sorghi]|uniref:Uncharacterized protein n=1 Tax=Peronosclerospora sorghi TaxID=230839 RepID=A0ACC0WIS5_9STRA|nr:hypothetical protein PsorP6_012291 [Peronosclerospora sorghi]